jgi:hypothetical protein
MARAARPKVTAASVIPHSPSDVATTTVRSCGDGRMPRVTEDPELFVDARWGARPQSLDQVTDAALRFVAAVRAVTGFTAEVLELVSDVDLADPVATRTWIESTAYRDDAGRTYPDDGYFPAFVFEGAGGQVVVSTSAGRAVSGSRVAANTVHLTLRGSARRFADELLDQTVEVWDPDFATIVDEAVMSAMRVPHRSVRLGYRTVIAARLVRTLRAPRGYRLTRPAGRYELRLKGALAAERVAAANRELLAADGIDAVAQRVP